MDATSRFNRCIFEWERTLLKIVGHDFLGETFKKNLITYMVYFTIAMANGSMIYTFMLYGTLERIFSLLFFLIAVQVNLFRHIVFKLYLFSWILCIIYLYLLLQCIVKLYHIRYVEDLQWIIRFIQNLYEIHTKTKSPERKEYFNNFAMATELLFKVITTLYILSVFTFFPYPIYMYLFKHEVVTIIPLYLPLVDDKTFIGYVFLCSFQVLMFFWATLGVLACDFFMAIIIISTLIFSKLISLDLQQLEIDFQIDNSDITVKGRFRNILLMHQEMIK